MFKYHLEMNIPQKSVQGSQFIGATSVVITSHNNYDNHIFRNDDGEFTRIEMQGTGGRIYSYETKKFEMAEHQTAAQNYPLMISSEKDLPIRVFLTQKDKSVMYLGLWKCVAFGYGCENKNKYKTYQFVLEPIK